MCMQDDCLCHVLHSAYTIADGGIDCDYYLAAVLPTDAELHDRILAQMYHVQRASWVTDDAATTPLQEKKCTRCGKPFVPASNRQKYCIDCSIAAEKKRNAHSHWKQYWQDR